jgi:inner membrane protein involved in colicin E2 resistance
VNLFGYSTMRKKYIDYAIVGCLFFLVVCILYSVVKLYIFFQRVDMSIIISNVILFAVVAAAILLLLKKRSDIEEGELLGD